MISYADADDLAARLSARYSVPDNAEQLLAKASELIDEATLGRAFLAWDFEEDETLTPMRDVLLQAACDQVEFWLEVGEEHDVAGLRGSLVAGRLQVHPVPYLLGARAKRTLFNGGLLWAGVAAR